MQHRYELIYLWYKRRNSNNLIQSSVWQLLLNIVHIVNIVDAVTWIFANAAVSRYRYTNYLILRFSNVLVRVCEQS